MLPIVLEQSGSSKHPLCKCVKTAYKTHFSGSLTLNRWCPLPGLVRDKFLVMWAHLQIVPAVAKSPSRFVASQRLAHLTPLNPRGNFYPQQGSLSLSFLGLTWGLRGKNSLQYIQDNQGVFFPFYCFIFLLMDYNWSIKTSYAQSIRYDEYWSYVWFGVNVTTIKEKNIDHLWQLHCVPSSIYAIETFDMNLALAF